MHTTQRYLYQPADLEGAAKALDYYDTPVDACVRVIYTSQAGAEWKYCIGLCVFACNAGADSRQDYPAFIFVSKVFKSVTVKQLLASLASSEGLRVAPDLPSIPFVHDSMGKLAGGNCPEPCHSYWNASQALGGPH